MIKVAIYFLFKKTIAWHIVQLIQFDFSATHFAGKQISDDSYLLDTVLGGFNGGEKHL